MFDLVGYLKKSYLYREQNHKNVLQPQYVLVLMEMYDDFHWFTIFYGIFYL